MLRQRLTLLEKAKKARQECGKSYISQAADILSLRLGFSRLGPADYYQYGLYDEEKFSPQARRTFLGWRGQSRIDRRLNGAGWHFSHSDKVVSTLLLERIQLPVPRIFAVCDSRRRHVPDIRFILRKDELRDFLTGASFPLFVKPVDNALGRGAMRVERYDASANALVLGDGKFLPFEEAWSRIEGEVRQGRGGMLIQECVAASRELGGLTGGRLSTLRIVLTYLDLPRITHAVIKFPVGSNVTDNFRGGSCGNLVGRVGLQSGRIEAVYGLRDGSFHAVERHPDTACNLIGFEIPQWNRYSATVERAASCFPGMGLQHWDVAVSQDGPCILELNADGCVQLPQVAYQRGLYDGAIKEAYERVSQRAYRAPVYGGELQLALGKIQA